MVLLAFTQAVLPLIVVAIGGLVAWHGFRFTLQYMELRIKDAGAYLFGILVAIIAWFTIGVVIAVSTYVGFLRIAF